MKNKTKILVIDDEPTIRKLLRQSLQSDTCTVEEASTAEEGMRSLQDGRPDLVLLDWGLPDQDGLSVLVEIRKRGQTPVIMLTVQNQDQHKVAALDHGADDYMTKPFSIDELRARVRLALRHSHQTGLDDVFCNGPLRIEYPARKVYVADQEVKLTATEYNLLRFICSRVGRVITQTEILTEIWGPNHVDSTQYLRVYLGQLRKKLEKDADRPVLLLTELGVGYRMPLIS